MAHVPTRETRERKCKRDDYCCGYYCCTDFWCRLWTIYETKKENRPLKKYSSTKHEFYTKLETEFEIQYETPSVNIFFTGIIYEYA